MVKKDKYKRIKYLLNLEKLFSFWSTEGIGDTYLAIWVFKEIFNQKLHPITAQKMKFSSKDFFSKCDQIRSFLQIWSHLLKNSLMENFIFRAVNIAWFWGGICTSEAFIWLSTGTIYKVHRLEQIENYFLNASKCL